MGGKQIRPRLQSASEADRKFLESDCEALRRKLQKLREQRNRVKAVREEGTSVQLHKWNDRHNRALRERDLALEGYEAASARHTNSAAKLRFAQEWNVTNDCFHIWHRGPFGTINGLRLGSEAPPLPPLEAPENKDGPNGAYKSSLMGYGLSTAPTPAPPTEQNTRVPWVEINSALGLLTLLLSTLEKKPQSGIAFHNKLVPMGSTSKIGVKKGEVFTFYSLYSDDSFQFFGKRNFNIALGGLLMCVAEAAKAVQDRDRTIELPHPIETTPKGDTNIGGLPIGYGVDGDHWTQAMKYLLTDVKWLVAFCAKHVDR